MPLRHRDRVDQVPVFTVVVPERRQPREPPEEQHPEPGQHGQRDQPTDRVPLQPSSLSRSKSFPSRVRAIAASTISGYATPETTSIDSATSGAWSTRKSSVTTRP